LLKVERINAGYGYLQVLRNVSIAVNDGEFVSILGPNGAGKTTTLRTISGLIKPSTGKIHYNNEDITVLSTHEIVHRGISYVTENMNLFVNMTVFENLLMGAYIVKDDRRVRKTVNLIFDVFPRLAERKNQLAGTLSGGERKMLAIARGIMSNPKLILIDEPSLGLQPNLVDSVFDTLVKLHREGITILLVEQDVIASLEITQRTYLLEKGEIVLEGKSEELKNNPHIKNVYVGI